MNAEFADSVWRPVNSAHAIQSVYGAVVFAQPVTNVVWNRISQASRKLAKEMGLPEEAPIQTFQMLFTPGAGPVPMPPMQAEQSGFEFFRKANPNFITDKLTIESSSLRLDTWAYTRWVGFEEKLKASLLSLFDQFAQAVSVRQIVLEYVDIFVATSEGDVDSSIIIDPSSECLAKKAFHSNSQWHSHVGWFEDQTASSRILVNADVTVGDANTPVGIRRSITIRTHQAHQYLSNAEGDTEAQKLSVEGVLAIFNGLHVSLKERIGMILTPQGRQMISLGVD